MMKNVRSNINEVIRAVLNFFFFFFFNEKIFYAQKEPKAPKRTKSTKTQPSKSTKCKLVNKNLKCA